MRSSIVSISIAVALSCASATAAAVLPIGFREIAVTGNTISSATAMKFAPDGKLFVLQQTGQIQVFAGTGHTTWTRLQANFLANVPISVDSFFERGMLRPKAADVPRGSHWIERRFFFARAWRHMARLKPDARSLPQTSGRQSSDITAPPRE